MPLPVATATRPLDGKAGFKVPIVALEVGGGGRRQHADAQKVTVHFGRPMDRDGNPVKVACDGNELLG